MPRAPKTSSARKGHAAPDAPAAPEAPAAPVVPAAPPKAPPGRARAAARSSTKKSAAKSSPSSFVEDRREALLAERASYLRQAEELKAEADSLALEHEPGDVQFDEEGGEGGTSNVDRELDLLLSAQARAAIEEIDRALAKIEAGTYGTCEHCGEPIAEARLEALPYAALCVSCKSGGLSSRR